MAKKTQITRLKPPAAITDEALLEWGRICKELATLGLLEKSSRARLVLYCQWWMTYESAARVVASEGAVKKFNKNKTVGVHPALKVMDVAAGHCRRLLFDLGLTSVKRSTLGSHALARDLDLA